MRVIGLTGGVGSGKSRILTFMQEVYQAEVIQADLVAKQLEEPGAAGYQGLVALLGTSILEPSGEIDKKKLAQLIFTRDEIRRKVNDIIHPLTWEAIRGRIKKSQQPLVVVEAALLDEKADDIYDELWYVYTSEDIRIERLHAQRGYTRERVLAMMESQPTEQEYRLRADFEIDNNGTPESVNMQIIKRIGKQQGTP